MIKIIVASTINGIIGFNNSIPWKSEEDMKHFRETTMGHNVVMGKNTFLSLPKMLDGRRNIILSKSLPSIDLPTLKVVRSVEEVLETASPIEKDIFIIGGSKVYEQFLPLADEIIMSMVIKPNRGDAVFPKINYKDWEQTNIKTISLESPIKHVVYYKRIK